MTNTNPLSDAARQARKPYEPPQLKSLGTIVDITQGGDGFPSDNAPPNQQGSGTM